MEFVENDGKEDINCCGQTLSTPMCSLLFFVLTCTIICFGKEGKGGRENCKFGFPLAFLGQE
jgi:hypothetical protein